MNKVDPSGLIEEPRGIAKGIIDGFGYAGLVVVGFLGGGGGGALGLTTGPFAVAASPAAAVQGAILGGAGGLLVGRAVGEALVWAGNGIGWLTGKAGQTIATMTSKGSQGVGSGGSGGASGCRREVPIRDPNNPGRTIGEIDRIEGGILWEEKSASSAIDPIKWAAKHVTNKFARYLEMRRHVPGYEKAPIGFDFSGSPDAALRKAIDGAVNALRNAHPGVDIRVRFQ